MKCLPAECDYCEPWDGVAGKAKCCRPPIAFDPRPEFAYHNGWRYSTTLGGRCVAHEEPRPQLALF